MGVFLPSNSVKTDFSNYSRFKIHNQWPITNLILSLAFADLVYCLAEIPASAVLLISRKWLIGSWMCYAIATLRYVSFSASNYSLALIAVCRCIFVINFNLSTKIFSKYHGNLSVVLIWTISALYNLPIHLQVRNIDCNKSGS